MFPSQHQLNFALILLHLYCSSSWSVIECMCWDTRFNHVEHYNHEFRFQRDDILLSVVHVTVSFFIVAHLQLLLCSKIIKTCLLQRKRLDYLQDSENWFTELPYIELASCWKAAFDLILSQLLIHVRAIPTLNTLFKAELLLSIILGSDLTLEKFSGQKKPEKIWKALKAPDIVNKCLIFQQPVHCRRLQGEGLLLLWCRFKFLHSVAERF